MTPLAVTFRDLVDVGIAASLAGVGVTAVFSCALLGAIRAGEARRARQPSLKWAALAVAGSVGVLLACAAGVYVVAS